MTTQKEEYKLEKHVYHTDCRIVGKQYCINCGLISLNNEFTRWAEEKGCNYKDHFQLVSVRKRFTGFK